MSEARSEAQKALKRIVDQAAKLTHDQDHQYWSKTGEIVNEAAGHIATHVGRLKTFDSVNKEWDASGRLDVGDAGRI